MGPDPKNVPVSLISWDLQSSWREAHKGHSVDPTGVYAGPRVLAPRANKVHFCGLGSPEIFLLEEKVWSWA